MSRWDARPWHWALIGFIVVAVIAAALVWAGGAV